MLRQSSGSKIADTSCTLVPLHGSATKEAAGYGGGDARLMSTSGDFSAGGGGAGDGACRK